MWLRFYFKCMLITGLGQQTLRNSLVLYQCCNKSIDIKKIVLINLSFYLSIYSLSILYLSSIYSISIYSLIHYLPYLCILYIYNLSPNYLQFIHFFFLFYPSIYLSLCNSLSTLNTKNRLKMFLFIRIIEENYKKCERKYLF